MTSSKGPTGNYKVSSLERGLAILRAVQETDGPVRNGQVVNRTGLPKATVSRLMNTLSAKGYLRRIDRQGSYVLGEASARSGRAMLSSLQLDQHATALNELFQGQRFTVWLETRIGDRMTPVYRWSESGGHLLTSGAGADALRGSMTSVCFDQAFMELQSTQPAPTEQFAKQLTATRWCHQWNGASSSLTGCTGVRLGSVGAFVLVVELPCASRPSSSLLDGIRKRLLTAADLIATGTHESNGDAHVQTSS